MVRVAAIQLEPVLADIDANLQACERLATAAGVAGAEIIALPEFFSTGIGFSERLIDAVLPPDGPATTLLQSIASRFGALVGGSFLCRDDDGQVRNAYLLAGPDGVLGRHDKDLPTLWENAFYIGGSDPGIIEAGNYRVGAAVCWELMRTGTVRRLRGNIDFLMSGSGWWSVPDWPPAVLFERMERANAATAHRAATTFARFIGAPVIHAAHTGPLDCGLPWMPGDYHGRFEGLAVITDATGAVVAAREPGAGAGMALGDITPGSTAPLQDSPDRFWLHRRGALPAFAWHYHRWHGRRWYRRHMLTG
ncbi:carbon-nitrogen hydrolase family protein [Nocardia sp. NPDC057668]|uniref:carbon-nitrogen hydrolase family protein n=1 Tax=Nocardia sp. NPDC057668 TaxID=3346202 RepID=UPI00366F0C71